VPNGAVLARCKAGTEGSNFSSSSGESVANLISSPDTGQIIAAELTSNDVDDGSQVGPLLEQIAGPVASFTGDGSYDRDDVYREVCQRHPDAAVIVPPRSSAVPSATAQTAPTKRDRHLQAIAKRGAWAGSGHLVTIGVPWWRPISPATSE
jgi:hypothetical protein